MRPLESKQLEAPDWLTRKTQPNTPENTIACTHTGYKSNAARASTELDYCCCSLLPRSHPAMDSTSRAPPWLPPQQQTHPLPQENTNQPLGVKNQALVEQALVKKWLCSCHQPLGRGARVPRITGGKRGSVALVRIGMVSAPLSYWQELLKDDTTSVQVVEGLEDNLQGSNKALENNLSPGHQPECILPSQDGIRRVLTTVDGISDSR
eukprot:TRINITY_DN2979_c0_g1_i1.p2 TRINITY_DN2979_c0_g1~~TRINITY_DN2979_c0_g1_i1.p2  ORF type:complete len:208 (+),score=27.00 TRINITY_DN2979_c0_g1_i1:980-1603(+)